MRASLDILQTATRVLAALTDQRSPDPADVITLREYDGAGNGRDLDELACDAIKKVLRHRAQLQGR